jgi:hydroxymethylbilane synthase
LRGFFLRRLRGQKLKKVLKIGARPSPLSLAQTGGVRDAILERFPGLEVEIVPKKTRGDDPTRSPTGPMGIKGLFVKEIEEALLAGEIDLAVHSAKDLPSVLPGGLVLGAAPKREIPFDVLIGNFRGLRDLPPGAVVGTSSLRREARIRSLAKDPKIVPLRGNVDTRLKKVSDGEIDATILAASGLRRLKGPDYPLDPIPPEDMLPAPGQGILALEFREGDAWVKGFADPLNHPETELALEAERAFMRALGAGCQTPAAAWARTDGNALVMDAMVLSLDGSAVLETKSRVPGPDAEKARELGKSLASRLLADGADEFIAEAEKRSH